MITRAELFARATGTDLAAPVLAPFREIPVDRAIAERAGRIRRQWGFRMPDALIAATALERKLGLTTRNKKHFEQVRRLRITALS
ncbi:MAG: PIN domain-containing protein [Actinomycetota bacterium]|nr:PIN domain-containing protein [Actinomycetota bacterium]